MADTSDEAKQIEKLYEFGERLNEAKDKSQVGGPFLFSIFISIPRVFSVVICLISDSECERLRRNH